MTLLNFLEKGFCRMADDWQSRVRQPVPDRNRLLRSRIVSHRGEYDNRRVFENTLPAFERARKAGLWGVELDVRWTLDSEPVVFHDHDLRRLFNTDISLSQLTAAELEKNFPMIPRLSQVIEKYGQRLHLMVELKKDSHPDPACQNQMLQVLFAHLVPQTDFHLLSLYPEVLKQFVFVSPRACLPIVRLNVPKGSRLAIAAGYGGIAGHYQLLTDAVVKTHREKGQAVGTGYVASKNCLFREVNRGVKWIFSNRGAALQAIRRRYLD